MLYNGIHEYCNIDINKNIIYHLGDSLEFLKSLPSKFAKLAVTSPPYNLGKEYEIKISMKEYFELQKKIIGEIVRVVADNGSICWQTGNFVHDGEVFPLDVFYYDLFKEHDLYLRNRIIWHFGHGLHTRNRFSGRYETVLWFTKSDRYIFNLDDVRVPAKYPGKRHYKGPKKGQLSGNPKGKNPSDIWEILLNDWEKEIWEIPNVKSNHPEKTCHPCQFPVELVERMILVLTNEGDWVLDPYAGVGTSIIAAIKNNRKAIGIERESDYIDIGTQRILKYYDGTLKLRPINRRIHKPTGREKIAQVPKEWKEKGCY